MSKTVKTGIDAGLQSGFVKGGPTGSFNSFPNADGDDTTFGYGLAYKYSLSEDISIVASYMINDLGETNTGVTGAGIAGMNAGEQLQSEVEITQLTLGLQLKL